MDSMCRMIYIYTNIRVWEIRIQFVPSPTEAIGLHCIVEPGKQLPFLPGRRSKRGPFFGFAGIAYNLFHASGWDFASHVFPEPMTNEITI